MKQLSLFDQSFEHHNECAESSAGAHWKIFVDGAARNNPGPAGAGIYIVKEQVPMVKAGFYLGSKTNNQAEYYALLLGLYLVQPLLCPQDTLLIVSDSQLLIRQLQGVYKVKHPDLQSLHQIAKKAMQPLHVDVMHVLREDNKIADKLANQGIDQKKEVPQEFFSWLHKYGS
jgi:ribonuclease HI